MIIYSTAYNIIFQSPGNVKYVLLIDSTGRPYSENYTSQSGEVLTPLYIQDSSGIYWSIDIDDYGNITENPQSNTPSQGNIFGVSNPLYYQIDSSHTDIIQTATTGMIYLNPVKYYQSDAYLLMEYKKYFSDATLKKFNISQLFYSDSFLQLSKPQNASNQIAVLSAKITGNYISPLINKPVVVEKSSTFVIGSSQSHGTY